MLFLSPPERLPWRGVGGMTEEWEATRCILCSLCPASEMPPYLVRQHETSLCGEETL